MGGPGECIGEKPSFADRVKRDRTQELECGFDVLRLADLRRIYVEEGHYQFP